MVAGCGPKIAKLSLFIVNIAIWVASLGMLAIGIWIAVESTRFETLFADDTLVVVSWLMITLGSLLFLVGFTGCCGALKESPCLLNTYFTLVLIVTLGGVTVAILAFVYSSEIEDSMTRGMLETIAETYEEKDAATESIDKVQKEYACCGALSYSEYETSAGFIAKYPNKAVPVSCCKKDSSEAVCQQGTPGKPTNLNAVNDVGCVESSLDAIQDNFYIIGGILLGVLAVEVFAMIFACCVSNAVKDGVV